MAELPPAALSPVDPESGQAESISSTIAAGGQILDAAKQAVSTGIGAQLADAVSTINSVKTSLASQINAPLASASSQVSEAKSFVGINLAAQLSSPAGVLSAIQGQLQDAGHTPPRSLDCAGVCQWFGANYPDAPPGLSGLLDGGLAWITLAPGVPSPSWVSVGCVLPNGTRVNCGLATIEPAPSPPPPPPPGLLPIEPIIPPCKCPDGTYLNPEAPPPPDQHRPACPASYLGWSIAQWQAYVFAEWNPLLGVFPSDAIDLLSRCGVVTDAKPLANPGADPPTVKAVLEDNTAQYDYKTICDDYIATWCVGKPLPTSPLPPSPTVPPSTVTCPNCNISLSCPPPVINVQPCSPPNSGGLPYPLEPWEDPLAWKLSGEETYWQLKAVAFSGEWLAEFLYARSIDELIRIDAANLTVPHESSD